MLSEKKHSEIALVCYANVSGQFAMFCNPVNRGKSFDWRDFANMMRDSAESWMFIHDVKGNKKEVYDTARKYAFEIAETMLRRAGF